MFPVLFHIGNVPVETYYVTWFAALFLALRWCVRRMELYGIDDEEGRKIIAWGFAGMILGAYAANYVWDFGTYWNDPSLLWNLGRGGLSERGAITGAVAVAFVLCLRGGKVSFLKLCEVAVPPGFLVFALGRWGCFFAGCCVGVESTFQLALHFPYDAPTVFRHATQLYYSLFAALALPVLLFVEKKAIRRELFPAYPILAPLGIIFYSIMRITVGSLRLDKGTFSSSVVFTVMILLGAIWFLVSLNAFRKRDALLK